MPTHNSRLGESIVLMKSLMLAASSCFAVVPGLAVLVTGIGTPPGKTVLFSGMVEVSGVLAILILYVYRKTLAAMAKKRVTRASVIAAIASVFALIAYLWMHDLTCVTASAPDWKTFGPVYFPLVLSGELEEEVVNAGSRQAFIDKWGPRQAETVVARMSTTSWIQPLTTGILLIVYCGLFAGFTVAFGVVGFHIRPTL